MAAFLAIYWLHLRYGYFLRPIAEGKCVLDLRLCIYRRHRAEKVTNSIRNAVKFAAEKQFPKHLPGFNTRGRILCYYKYGVLSIRSSQCSRVLWFLITLIQNAYLDFGRSTLYFRSFPVELC